MKKYFYLWAEQISLFLIVPFLLWFYIDDLRSISGGGSFLVIFLTVLALILLVFLIKSNDFQNYKLLYIKNFEKHFVEILKFFIPSAIVYTLLTLILIPDDLFFLPKQNPKLWLLIMLAYPIMSVLPQGLIYRVFFFHRYKPLYKSSFQLILASGLFFCFAHIIFNNLVAIIFTFMGGFLFAYRYNQTKSWFISSLEHAMYGNLLFTIGIGKFLVAGLN